LYRAEINAEYKSKMKYVLLSANVLQQKINADIRLHIAEFNLKSFKYAGSIAEILSSLLYSLFESPPNNF